MCNCAFSHVVHLRSCIYRCTTWVSLMSAQWCRKRFCVCALEIKALNTICHTSNILYCSRRNMVWIELHTPPTQFTKCVLMVYFCFAVLGARVGRNNIFCISRDVVLTNQQLPTLYSSGVAKSLARSVWEKLHGNVWAESFKSRLCWFSFEFYLLWVAVFLQLAG